MYPFFSKFWAAYRIFPATRAVISWDRDPHALLAPWYWKAVMLFYFAQVLRTQVSEESSEMQVPFGLGQFLPFPCALAH